MKNIRLLVFLLCLLAGFTNTFAQERIQWRSIADVQELAKKQKKKILIDVYTEWCTWCKRMDRTTFQDADIARFVNEYFYAVRLNAEHKDEINFNDKVYKLASLGGGKAYNQFASELLKGRMSFPTIVFMDENLNVIQPIQGYSDAQKFEAIINYIAMDNYKKTPWTTYERNLRCNKNPTNDTPSSPMIPPSSSRLEQQAGKRAPNTATPVVPNAARGSKPVSNNRN